MKYWQQFLTFIFFLNIVIGGLLDILHIHTILGGDFKDSPIQIIEILI